MVFVDKRYYVLLDEIEPAQPATVELRFHSYGTIAPRAQGGWTATEKKVGLDVVPASGGGKQAEVAGVVEPAAGWTKPVNVLRLTTAGSVPRFVLATALLPSTAANLRGATVSQRVDGDEILVEIGRDRLTWRCGPGGCKFRGVSASR